jgi:hypothetical protein
MSYRRYFCAIFLSAVALFATIADAAHIHSDSQFETNCFICLQDNNQDSVKNADYFQPLAFNFILIKFTHTRFIASLRYFIHAPRAPPIIS